MDLPLYVTASVLVVGLFAALAPPVLISRVRPGPTAAVAGLLLLAWLALTALMASVGAYGAGPDPAAPPIGIVLAVALAGLGLAVAAIPQLRAVLRDPATQPALIGLQVWRIEGLAFLILFALGQLPPTFALPAGIGDVLIGVTALLMARNLQHRNLTVAWNLFGVADLVLAVSLGVTTNPGPLFLLPSTPTSEVLTAFPMAIVPTFLVPLSIGLHIASLRNLLAADARRPSHAPAFAPSR